MCRILVVLRSTYYQEKLKKSEESLEKAVVEECDKTWKTMAHEN